MSGAQHTFELVGGHPAIDLVNTVSWRLDPRRTVDRVPDLPELLRWARASELIDDAEAQRFRAAATPDKTAGKAAEPADDTAGDTGGAAAADRTLRAVRTLRETLHAILVGVAIGEGPPPEALAAFHRLVVDALGHASPALALPLHWSIELRDLADLPRALTLIAMELLRTEDLSRVHRCEAHDCGWLFIDRTRSHTRRWCSSADCGNRERARRHYARHRSARGERGPLTPGNH